MDNKTNKVIEQLNLLPHPEGGFYREIYRSEQKVIWQNATFSACTAIYFLLQNGDVSRFHRIPQDEVWHYYEGHPLELIIFNESDLKIHRVVLNENNRICTVPGKWWQAARTTGEYTLVGCTVSPGFEFELFEMLSDYPDKLWLFKNSLAEFSEFCGCSKI